MILIPLSQCRRSLDFKPRQSWPKVFPAIAWSNQIIAGFDRTTGLALDLGSQNLAEALAGCYNKLGLSEFARLAELVRAHLPEFADSVAEQLGAHLGWRWNERLQQTVHTLLATPTEFQDWCDERSLSAKDLAPLLAVNNVSLISPILSHLANIQATRSQGVQILEWSIELVLQTGQLSQALPSWPQADFKPELWLQHLYRLRRPRTSTADEDTQSQIRQWPLPAHVEAQWRRVGDQGGLELNIRAHTPDDLKAKLARIGELPNQWKAMNERQI